LVSRCGQCHDVHPMNLLFESFYDDTSRKLPQAY
jgi:hypothetical protein